MTRRALATVCASLFGAAPVVAQASPPTPACEGRSLADASLAELFREVADRMEAFEAPVAAAPRAQVAVSTAGVPVPTVLPGAPGTLVSLRDAETRLAETEARLAELLDLESSILARLDSALADAEARSAEILDTVYHEASRLEEIRARQAGHLDLVTALEGTQDTLLSMELPELFERAESFLSHFDDLSTLGVQDHFDALSSELERANLGAWFLTMGEELEGVDLGDLLTQMGGEFEGQALPPDLTQAIDAANQFGALGWVRMFKNQAKAMSVGALIAPLAQATAGLDLGAAFTDLAQHCEGDVAAALCFGLGSALSGMDVSATLEVLSQELEPITLLPVLAGAERLLMGGDFAAVCTAAGRTVKGVDVGETLTAIGHALEPFDLSTVAFRVGTEMEGITLGEATQELEQGLQSLGIDLDLPAMFEQSGAHLARAELPRRVEGLIGTLEDLDDYLARVRVEMGLEPTDLLDAFEGTRVVVAATECGEATSAVTQETRAALELARDQLEKLQQAGLGEDHPAIQKLHQRIASF